MNIKDYKPDGHILENLLLLVLDPEGPDNVTYENITIHNQGQRLLVWIEPEISPESAPDGLQCPKCREGDMIRSGNRETCMECPYSRVIEE